MVSMTRFTLLVLASMLFASLATFAKDTPEHTQFGRDIHIAADERSGDATCFGCSIYVRGQINGDATTFGGSIVLEEGASVTGDVTTFGGGLRAQAGSSALGDATTFGGHIRRDPTAKIGGDATSFGGFGWFILILALPLLFLAGIVALIVWLIRRSSRPPSPGYVPANTRV
jgi:hypothetical protein